MKKLIALFFSILFISCIFSTPFIEGKVEENKYENDFLSLNFPKDWESNRTSGFTIFNIQKKINSNGELGFPVALLDAGTIKNNSFHTNFNNLYELVQESFDMYKKNNIYITYDKIDTLKNNDLTFIYFETKVDNHNYKAPDILQTHYFFQIDTIYFELRVSDYDRFEGLRDDYKFILESIKKI